MTSSIFVSQPQLGRQDMGGHAGSWAGKLVQDWTGLPGIVPSEASHPIGEEISKLGLKDVWESKKWKK